MKTVLEALAGPIREWGYRGSGQNYRRVVDDIIFVINIQKSRDGDHFFVNMGGQPTAIDDDADRAPNPRTAKEYECVFRQRLSGRWQRVLSADEIVALTRALDDARRDFERSVLEVRELSREGRAQELFDRRRNMGTGARATLVLARLLAADGHSAGARELAEHAIVGAGDGAVGLRYAAERLLASLPTPTVVPND